MRLLMPFLEKYFSSQRCNCYNVLSILILKRLAVRSPETTNKISNDKKYLYFLRMSFKSWREWAFKSVGLDGLLMLQPQYCNQLRQLAAFIGIYCLPPRCSMLGICICLFQLINKTYLSLIRWLGLLHTHCFMSVQRHVISPETPGSALISSL